MSQSRYTKEFKEEALKQIMEEGIPVLQVSKSLGVSDAILYKWFKEAGLRVSYSKEKMRLSSAEEEIKQLKSELKKVKEERDILKKATAFFAAETK